MRKKWKYYGELFFFSLYVCHCQTNFIRGFYTRRLKYVNRHVCSLELESLTCPTTAKRRTFRTKWTSCFSVTVTCPPCDWECCEFASGSILRRFSAIRDRYANAVRWLPEKIIHRWYKFVNNFTKRFKFFHSVKRAMTWKDFVDSMKVSRRREKLISRSSSRKRFPPKRSLYVINDNNNNARNNTKSH